MNVVHPRALRRIDEKRNAAGAAQPADFSDGKCCPADVGDMTRTDKRRVPRDAPPDLRQNLLLGEHPLRPTEDGINVPHHLAAHFHIVKRPHDRIVFHAGYQDSRDSAVTAFHPEAVQNCIDRPCRVRIKQHILRLRHTEKFRCVFPRRKHCFRRPHRQGMRRPSRISTRIRHCGEYRPPHAGRLRPARRRVIKINQGISPALSPPVRIPSHHATLLSVVWFFIITSAAHPSGFH